MTGSLALLAIPHSEAANTIIADALKAGVNPDYLYPGTSSVQQNGKGLLPVYIDSDAYNDPSWPYRGSTQLTYNRVDLNEALGHLNLTLKVTRTFTSAQLVAKLASILQLYFEAGDYVAETRTLNTASAVYTLKAAADSPRWAGQLQIHVHL
ncbi:hypothetical protein LUCX_292 [Xanthomonas phage vB_XciM_LucasX]|nr:hypothetical protein LUCX_292 [Xanthomonas phage vB_XciM_LucasX]